MMNDWDYRIPKDDPASPSYRRQEDDIDLDGLEVDEDFEEHFYEDLDRADHLRKQQQEDGTMKHSTAIGKCEQCGDAYTFPSYSTDERQKRLCGVCYGNGEECETCGGFLDGNGDCLSCESEEEEREENEP